MADDRTEARRQLDYIEAELAAGNHQYEGRAKMLAERRRIILEKNPKEA